MREKIIEEAENYIILLEKQAEKKAGYKESFEKFVNVLKDEDALAITPTTVISAYIFEMGHDPYEASKIAKKIIEEVKQKYVLIDPEEIKKK